MGVAHWKRPVTFRTADGAASVSSPKEALDWLLNRWPLEHGQDYLYARACCRDSSDSANVADESRLAFIFAVLEAHAITRMLDNVSLSLNSWEEPVRA
jgi:hypothetical protein